MSVSATKQPPNSPKYAFSWSTLVYTGGAFDTFRYSFFVVSSRGVLLLLMVAGGLLRVCGGGANRVMKRAFRCARLLRVA